MTEDFAMAVLDEVPAYNIVADGSVDMRPVKYKQLIVTRWDMDDDIAHGRYPIPSREHYQRTGLRAGVRFRLGAEECFLKPSDAVAVAQALQGLFPLPPCQEKRNG